jgi:hexosaminidase
MKKTYVLSIFLAALTLGRVCDAQNPAAARELRLLPAPREFTLGNGHFQVGTDTKILLDTATAGEDRTAAEMLAQEIAEQVGLKVPIEIAGGKQPRSGGIALKRLSDPGVTGLMSGHGLRTENDFDPQGYVLFADEAGIVIAGNNGAGVFYGVQTLRQLLKPGKEGLRCPQIAIKDWPAMQWRGIQDDVSRGPIPTLEYMKKQIRTISAYKMNLFALYMEHVFDYESQPLIAPKEAAITPAELKELVSYAQKYYVTILPEQQTFGHFHHIVKHEVYADIAETPHGQSLTPVDDKSYQLIASMYAELAPLTPGPFLHIGTDEVFELGIGRSKSRTEEIGAGTVYAQHLLRVSEILKPYHKRLIFWGDIAGDYPEQLEKLPNDMIGMPWNYAARESFDDLLKPFKTAGLDVMVATGANNWEMIWPNLDVAFVNIRNFVRDGQKYGALGALNTTWNDDGEALLEMCWPAFVFGGAAGWQAGESSIEDFKASYDWAFYRNVGSTFRDVMENLNHSHSLLKSVGLQDARDELFWDNPFSATGAAELQKAAPIAHELRLSAEHALSIVYTNRNLTRANADSLDAMIFAAVRLDALGMKIQFSTEMNRAYWDSFNHQTDEEKVLNNFDEITGTNARLDDLRDITTRLRGMEEVEWAKQYRPYWQANVLLRYDRLAWSMESQIEAVREAQARYRLEKTLQPPQQLGFFLKPQTE